MSGQKIIDGLTEVLHWTGAATFIDTRACNCVGPQPGKPVCPCRMSALKIVDGRYVETIDHGPAPSPNRSE